MKGSRQPFPVVPDDSARKDLAFLQMQVSLQVAVEVVGVQVDTCI